MNEHEAILKDLSRYLRKKGIAAGVHRSNSDQFYIYVRDHYYYPIEDGEIVTYYDGKIYDHSPILLADPQYREKFYEYLKNIIN